MERDSDFPCWILVSLPTGYMRGKNSLALNSEVPPMHGQSDYIILLYCYWCWPEKGQKNEKERVHKVRNQDLWATNHLRVCLGKAVSAKGHRRRFVLLSSAWASHQELGMKDHCSTLNTHVKKEKSFIEAGKKKKRGGGIGRKEIFYIKIILWTKMPGNTDL